jgi:class 3 adenylate cyclase
MPAADEGAKAGEELAEVLRELGVPQDAIARAIESGDPEAAVLESAILPGRSERTVSPADVEAGGGPSAHEIVEIVQAWGFPPPGRDEPALTPEEARVFVDLAELRDIWAPELTIQLARIYGRLLARIARTGVQLFRLYAGPRVREASDDREEELRSLQEAIARLLTLPDPILAGVHRRYLEYELAQTAIGEVEAHSDQRSLIGAVDITFLFCDLKDFTAFANAEGDAAAVDVISTFARVVDAERGEAGRVVKALGDGHMLCYSDVGEAVSAGRRIIGRMRSEGPLGVHASVHTGIAISREGDYFGGAVNLAARLLAAAEADELVATEPVVSHAGDEFDWEPLGTRRIRGVDDPVDVFRLRG